MLSLPLQKEALRYLAGLASCLADVDLQLPARHLEAIVALVEQHSEGLRVGDAARLQRAFDAWGYQPGQVLMARLLSGDS